MDDISRLKQELALTQQGELEKQLYKLLEESNNPQQTLELLKRMGYSDGLERVGYNLKILEGKKGRLGQQDILSVFKPLKKYDRKYIESLPPREQLKILKSMYPTLRDSFKLGDLL